MTQLIAIQSLGRNRDTPRLWIESQRLSSLGFPPGTPLQVEQRTDSLTLRAGILAENHVSSRAAAGGRRPIIDLENQSLLSGLAEYSEVKIIASFERIHITPSTRAFAVQPEWMHVSFEIALHTGCRIRETQTRRNEHRSRSAGACAKPRSLPTRLSRDLDAAAQVVESGPNPNATTSPAFVARRPAGLG